MKIANHEIADGARPLMIAEEGQANQGDMEVARQMCAAAHDGGADGIEFQFFWADDLYVEEHEYHALYKGRELSYAQISELIDLSHEHGLFCQVAGLSPAIVEQCANSGADVFSVNATDINNPFILDAVVRSGKPFWIATLMATMDEIEWAVKYVRSKGAENFGLLHGQHVMSTDHSRGVPAEMLQLDCITLLQQKFEVCVGFIDHTATGHAPALAVCKGAKAVTKHLAPRHDWKGPDFGICLTPEEFKQARALFDYACLASGNSKELSEEEMVDRGIARRSLYSARPLSAGQRLEVEDLIALRPCGDGTDPRSLDELVGRELQRDIGARELVGLDDFKPQ